MYICAFKDDNVVIQAKATSGGNTWIGWVNTNYATKKNKVMFEYFDDKTKSRPPWRNHTNFICGQKNAAGYVQGKSFCEDGKPLFITWCLPAEPVVASPILSKELETFLKEQASQVRAAKLHSLKTGKPMGARHDLEVVKWAYRSYSPW